MNKYIATMLAASLGLGVAQADMGAPAPAVKDMEVAIDEVNYVETAQKGIVLSGFVDAGYTYNFLGDGATGVAGRTANVDTDNKGDFSLNQVYLSLEKPLSDANELQGGFKVGLLMGEDADNVVAGGLSGVNAGGSSSFAVEDAYVMLRLPYGNGIDMKVGKFSTLLGYELNHRKDNFNISYGLDFFSATSNEVGVELSYAFNDNVTYTQRVVNGQYASSDTSLISTGAPANRSDDYGFEGLLSVVNNEGNASINAGYYVSINNGGFGAATERESSVMGSLNGTWAPKFANDKLTLAFSLIAGDAPTTQGRNTRSTWITPSLYAKYQFNDLFSLAGRASYGHTSDNSAVAYSLNGLAGDEDIWNYTLTAGFDLTENLLFRTEYRVDLGNDIYRAGPSDVAHTLAAQVVYSF